jgi:hypothetical protein
MSSIKKITTFGGLGSTTSAIIASSVVAGTSVITASLVVTADEHPTKMIKVQRKKYKFFIKEVSFC